jgi:transposase InsO family protein
MGSVGDAFDNAMCESFFASLECQLLDRYTFKSQTEARLAIFRYIEGWYNPHRRHSALDRWQHRPGLGAVVVLDVPQLTWCTPS